MKNVRTTIAKVVALVVLASASGFVAAAGSTTLAVSGSVTGACKFSATSTPLAFGTIDQSLTTDKTATADVLYKCTKGTAATGVTATGGLTRSMAGPGTETMGYTLSFSGATQTGTGFGAGQDLTLVVTGTITAAQYQNVAAGAYSENVTLNILP